ncbi:MAG: hypothetical protein D6695_11155 [Planctomycetota bacterium]|nr:MAG: hypothetical protein D6695_11155 [Planctomycetota bacterium]
MGIAEAQDGWMNLATHLLVALVIVALALTSWLWPRWGGMALGAAGVWAAWFFTGSFAWIFLASPAVVLGGLGILIDGSRPEAELPAGK